MCVCLQDIKHYQKLVKSKDIYGFTPLHYAAKCGNLALFLDLLKLGSSLALKSNKKQTVLHLAAQYVHQCFPVVHLNKGRHK